MDDHQVFHTTNPQPRLVVRREPLARTEKPTESTSLFEFRALSNCAPKRRVVALPRRPRLAFTARKDTNAVMNSSAISFAALCCVALVLFFPAAALQAGEALELSPPQPAEPLPGKLVICGGGPIPEAVYQQFVDWAGGPH